MKPVIALVGRPNVGKSTLFNCLTRTRDALVADIPGLTRDRQYGDGRLGERGYIVVDTGGLSDERDELDGLMARQAQQAIEEADIVLWLVDARAGLTAADYSIADTLRRCARPVRVVVNKIDGLPEAEALGEFYALGMNDPFPIAASHNRGVSHLIRTVLAELPGDGAPAPEQAPGVRVALVGRPNVGKSTLANRMLGEERVLAYDQPGTTRDSIYIPLKRDGEPYTLIDTAGIRRRGKVRETVEKFSIVKALQAIGEANVVILVLDAREGVVEQDMSLLGEILDQGRALIVAVNKWDGLSPEQRDHAKNDLDRRLGFLNYIEQRFISALHGTGVGGLFELALQAYQDATRALAASHLTELLEQAAVQHQPPLVRGRRIKLRYAHQGGKNPPVIVIHGNQVQRLPDDYRRYLAHFFQKQLKMRGTPVRIELKSGDNPYKNKYNTLTPRQQYKRKRLKKYLKKQGKA